MTAFPLLSDERIDAEYWRLEVAREMEAFSGVDLLMVAGHQDFARAIESESRAPLLAEIERLTREVERLKADAEDAKRASFIEGYDAAEADAKVCMVPPLGWNCTREAGHEGPCAAVHDKDAEAFVKAGMKRIADAEQCEADELDTSDCQDCAGDGFTWESRQVAERASDVQEFKIDCATCCGRGYVGPDAYRRSAIDAARAQGGE